MTLTQNKSILVVEDDGILAESLCNTLKKLGYTPLTPVASGERAVTEAFTKSPDLILMDIELAGGMDGISAARKIHLEVNIPVIFLTSYSQDFLIEKAKTANPYGYLIKPVHERELVATMEMTFSRRDTEKKLQESEERYRLVFQHSGDGILLGMQNGTIHAANRAICTMLGRTEEEICKIGRNGIINLNDPRLDPALAERSVTKNFNGELTFVRKNGEIFPAEVSSYVFTASDGTERTSIIVRDLTERKKAEEKIMALSKAIEQSPVSIVITDVNGSIQYVNRKFTEITGYSREEAIGENPRILKTGAQSQEYYQEMYDTILSGKEWKGTFLNKKKNGVLYWESAVISAIQDAEGKAYQFVAVKEDITERKRMQEALQASEERYHSLVENVKEVIFQTDAQGLWLFLNKAWEEITGFSVQESVGRLFLDYIHPDDRQRNAELFEPLILRKKDYCRHEIRYLTKDGGFRWTEVYAKLAINQQDEVTGTYGTLMDISDRKNAEIALEIANEKLRQTNHEKDKFFSIIAHDLRSPFSVFLHLTKQMAEDLQYLPISEIATMSDNMQKSASTMYELLENLLEWSSMQRGVSIFAPNPCVFSLLVKQNLGLIQEAAKQKNIALTSTIAENLTLPLDVPMINIVLRNLLSNAVKFTPHDGTIVVASQEYAHNVVISIQDSGIGMTQETIGKLFRLDEKVSRLGTEGEPSTGLGLLLCKEFVEKHGGKIWLQSSVGKGSTFYFSLPTQ